MSHLDILVESHAFSHRKGPLQTSNRRMLRITPSIAQNMHISNISKIPSVGASANAQRGRSQCRRMAWSSEKRWKLEPPQRSVHKQLFTANCSRHRNSSQSSISTSRTAVTKYGTKRKFNHCLGFGVIANQSRRHQPYSGSTQSTIYQVSD
jgi:hypothetical protein